LTERKTLKAVYQKNENLSSFFPRTLRSDALVGAKGGDENRLARKKQTPLGACFFNLAGTGRC